MGTGLELDVIAAVVLGGTNIFGGVGTIAGTVIGLVLIQLLKNGLALTGVTRDATIIVIGSVLILSILINNFVQLRRGTPTEGRRNKGPLEGSRRIDNQHSPQKGPNVPTSRSQQPSSGRLPSSSWSP